MCHCHPGITGSDETNDQCHYRPLHAAKQMLITTYANAGSISHRCINPPSSAARGGSSHDQASWLLGRASSLQPPTCTSCCLPYLSGPSIISPSATLIVDSVGDWVPAESECMSEVSCFWKPSVSLKAVFPSSIPFSSVTSNQPASHAWCVCAHASARARAHVQWRPLDGG